jgi:hypothetical protein
LLDTIKQHYIFVEESIFHSTIEKSTSKKCQWWLFKATTRDPLRWPIV